MAEKRDDHLSIYLRQDEKRILKLTAEADGMMLSSWARRTLLKAAKAKETTNADHDLSNPA